MDQHVVKLILSSIRMDLDKIETLKGIVGKECLQRFVEGIGIKVQMLKNVLDNEAEKE